MPRKYKITGAYDEDDRESAGEVIDLFFENHPEIKFISAQLEGSSLLDSSYRWDIVLTLWFTAPISQKPLISVKEIKNSDGKKSDAEKSDAEKSYAEKRDDDDKSTSKNNKG